MRKSINQAPLLGKMANVKNHQLVNQPEPLGDMVMDDATIARVQNGVHQKTILATEPSDFGGSLVCQRANKLDHHHDGGQLRSLWTMELCNDLKVETVRFNIRFMVIFSELSLPVTLE